MSISALTHAVVANSVGVHVALSGERPKWLRATFVLHAITPMPSASHVVLHQIGCGNRRHQGSGGAAGVTGLMILKGPDLQHRRGLMIYEMEKDRPQAVFSVQGTGPQ
ncbi:hypothetical protein [Bradyrhizobium sp. 25ACV]